MLYNKSRSHEHGPLVRMLTEKVFLANKRKSCDIAKGAVAAATTNGNIYTCSILIGRKSTQKFLPAENRSFLFFWAGGLFAVRLGCFAG